MHSFAPRASSQRKHSAGFTLVELLVVITIIGILIALLLPAVQAARESARRTQCMNNLKQIGMAALQHEQNQGILPTGGWGYGWAGDPNRGCGTNQPGGFSYNILPFIEQQALHDLGMGLPAQSPQYLAALGQAFQTPIAAFNCPSRRPLAAMVYQLKEAYNLTPGSVAGRSDYAACGGDSAPSSYTPGPVSYAAGDSVLPQVLATHSGAGAFATDALNLNGICFLVSAIKMAHITDGASNTLLTGEKYLNPDHYFDGQSWGDDQGWDIGFDWDNNRWAGPTGPLAQDQSGQDFVTSFGSAHNGTSGFVFCDGSVHAISYSIDSTLLGYLANRADGQPIDWSKVQ